MFVVPSISFSHKKGSLGSSWGGGGSRFDRQKLIKSEKILFYNQKQQPKTQQVKQEWLMMTVLSVYRSRFLLLFYFFFFDCQFENTLENYKDFCLANREVSVDNMLCCRVCLFCPHTVVPACWCKTCWCVIHSPWEIVDPNPVFVNHNTSRHHPQEDLCVALVLKAQRDIKDVD